MKFRNFKMVDYVVFGRGCFNQLDEILASKRTEGAPMVFLLDHYFADNQELISRIPLRGNDILEIADVTHEPKTSYIDELADKFKNTAGKVSG